MPTSEDPRMLDYAAVRPSERARWRSVLGVIATVSNGILALACVAVATQLAPQFGDATSRNGVVVPLIFWKLPLLIVVTMSFAIVTRRMHKLLGRLAFACAWGIVAVWIAVALLLFAR